MTTHKPKPIPFFSFRSWKMWTSIAAIIGSGAIGKILGWTDYAFDIFFASHADRLEKLEHDTVRHYWKHYGIERRVNEHDSIFNLEYPEREIKPIESYRKK